MLTAKAMGYDSCLMIGFDPPNVAEVITLPSGHVIGFMIAVGKALVTTRHDTGTARWSIANNPGLWCGSAAVAVTRPIAVTASRGAL
jgi:nitroreductase